VNILVTGGAGFIGSNLCRHLLANHPEDTVSVIDALTYAGHLSTIEDLEANPRFRFHQGRIEDPNAVRRIIQTDHIEAIINCAAETHNDRSLLAADDFLKTNVLGVHVLLEAVRDLGVSRLVQVSTDEVYGSLDSGEFTEQSALRPNTPYSASKAAGDHLCQAYFTSFETPVIITRGGNTYGPYQFPEKLISLSLSRLIQDKKVALYGEGEQVREWIHVSDHAAGIDYALRYGFPGDIYNVGDKNERRNIEIILLLLKFLDKSDSLIKRVPDPRGGAHDARYSMNCSKLRALGWSPTVEFESGLRETVEWYLHHQRWWKSICAMPEYQAYIRRFYGPGLGDDL
jgi:dTDP-glucose 4,6-dehydratase